MTDATARPSRFEIDRGRHGLVLGFFFLSGATGLVYQGIWFRHLQALFGVTTHALAVVVAAFMGGLAAGSWLFGRRADRSAAPLRLYALLEIGVGLLAPLVAVGVALIERLYVALHPAFAASLLALSILRLVLAFAVLFAPTVLMGGTLPALTVLLRRDATRRGQAGSLHRDLARLYGMNTLGAVAGTLLVGFVLLVGMGLLRTTLVAAATNVLIGFVCWRLASRRDTASAATADPSPKPGGSPPGNAPLGLVRVITIAFAISGGVSLAYELAWTRVLTQIIGSSTYAFSMILAAFLLGVGLGSLLLMRWKGRDGAAVRGFCAAQLGIAATAALVVPLLVRLPDLQLRGFASIQGMHAVLALQFGLCLVAVLPPTLCMGMTLPFAAGFVASRASDVGRSVGRLYAGNTLGGIVGSVLAGFVAIPIFGTQRTLLCCVLANLGLAVACSSGLRLNRISLWPAAHRSLWITLTVLAVIAVAIGLRTPRWDPYVLDAGIAIGGPSTSHGDRSLTTRGIGHGSDILWYREGLNANISVRKDETQLYLKTNGKTDGTSHGDMPTQLMLGVLPSLVHPRPQSTLVIGLGTGASARAALAPSTLQKLDVIEIEPAVVAAARRYFGVVNAGLFDDARVQIRVEDARTFLLTTPERYDVIVSEPSNPWIAGVASLFTVDHYERCAARLAPGGVVAQWLQIYAMQPELVQMVLASMRQVFPHQAIWSFHLGDLIVLGSREPLAPIDPVALDARLGEWKLRKDLRRVLGVESAAGVLGFHLLDDADTGRWATGARLNTEDRPRLEFAAPLCLYLSTRDSNAALLRAARRTLLPPLAAGSVWRGDAPLDLARAALFARRPQDAESWATQALADSKVSRSMALEVSGETALALEQVDVARARLEAALQLDPQASDAACSLALLSAVQGRMPEAITLLAVACATDVERTPQQLESRARLLDLVLERGQAAPARAGAEALLAPGGEAAMDSTLHARYLGIVARAALQMRDTGAAETSARAALALNPQSTAAWRVLGTLAFEAKQYPEAIRWWERCVDYRQSDAELLLPLALAYRRSGNERRAQHELDRVLAQDPHNATARRLRGEH